MAKRYVGIMVAAALLVSACSHKDQTTTSNSSNTTTTDAATNASIEPAAPASPMANGPSIAKFTFSDVAVTSSAAPVLRLGFDLKNTGSDPLLCDASEFSIRLSDDSTIPVDSSADVSCTPDTIDPGASAKGVMFFNLKGPYSGPVTLIMTVNNAIAGQGTAQLH
ncbi:MAG: hypothetical protein M3Z37_07850 [Candidatus Eremiobacteraeota bacterium]|nr:hypothetical protein [Candidatus Eremiobacteraeota bacterium]